MRVSRTHQQALWRIGLVCALVAAVWASSSLTVSAHEIPADVTIRVLVKPEGQTLRLLVRAPLESMRDVIFPTREPGFLELTAAERAVRIAAELWIANGVRVWEEGQPLARPVMTAVQVSLPSDRSFDTWEQALAHVTGAPLPADTQLLWTQAQLDVLLEFPVKSDASRFAIETDFARLGVRTRSVVRFLPPGGAVRVFEYMGDAGVLDLDPRWFQAARRFVVSGVEHILGGVDHLLFLLCLVVPVIHGARPVLDVARPALDVARPALDVARPVPQGRGTLKPLVLMATAFTVAHSITLIAAAFEFVPSGLWFPPLVETLIALSIVWMALENIVGVSQMRRRWALTFAFGLVHGFGFSFALRETLQFGGSHFVTSLVAFNVGVEIGQVLALLVIVPALSLLFRYVVPERIGGILISALVAHEAWHWMMARGATLFEHEFPFTAREMISVALRAAIVIWLAAWGYWYAKRRKLAN